MKLLKIITFVVMLINSCSYPELVRDEMIYENDFESENLDFIYGGNISYFNNTKVVGDYNNDGFTLHIDDAGDHDYIFIAFDLYIHGTWDGNSNGFPENDKPDFWGIEINPNTDLFRDPSADNFKTTFSNSPCYSNYCLRQSYPDSYPTENLPQQGVLKRNLKKKCTNSFFGGETSLYKIEKTFKSSGNSVVIRFFDELYQPNAIDKNGIVQSKCDESWSLDNLNVRVLKFQ